MNNLINFFNIICSDSVQVDEAQEDTNKIILIWGSLFLCLISCVLTVLNVLNGNHFMCMTTAVLAVGFALASAAAKLGRHKISRVLMAVLCGVNFSVYAVTGGNNGFAILWMVLVPVLSMMLLGLRMGFLLSVYFQVFLIVLFYTPLSVNIDSYYTKTFLVRFPILYFTSLALATFLMCERQKFLVGMQDQAFHDGLTGLYNHHYSTEISESFDAAGSYENLSVIVIDINQLKAVNDTYGHLAGDEIIVATAALIKSAFPDDLAFRMGGDEFMVVSESKDVAGKLAGFETLVAGWHGKLVNSLSVSGGMASRMTDPELKYEDLIKLADEKMYENKRTYYLENGMDRRS